MSTRKGSHVKPTSMVQNLVGHLVHALASHDQVLSSCIVCEGTMHGAPGWLLTVAQMVPNVFSSTGVPLRYRWSTEDMADGALAGPLCTEGAMRSHRRCAVNTTRRNHHFQCFWWCLRGGVPQNDHRISAALYAFMRQGGLLVMDWLQVAIDISKSPVDPIFRGQVEGMHFPRPILEVGARAMPHVYCFAT